MSARQHDATGEPRMPPTLSFPASGFTIILGSNRFQKLFLGTIRMNHFVKVGFGVALFLPLSDAARADDFNLSNNQRISCSRGLSAGKLNTATCKSYAYVFNTKTSEYFRCSVSLALTRDNKEVINVQTDGG